LEEHIIMGKLNEALDELMPKYKELLKISNDISTRDRSRDIKNRVEMQFKKLKPMSHRLKHATVVEGTSTNRWRGDWVRVGVGTWFRKSTYSSGWGQQIWDIYEFLKEYGDHLKPLVRGPIREDFSDMVDELKKMTLYEDLNKSVIFDEPKTLRSTRMLSYDRKMSINEFEATGIKMSTNNPGAINFVPRSGYSGYGGHSISNTDSLFLLEDIIDDVISIYEESRNELQAAISLNKKSLERMADITAPYDIARAL